MLMKISNGGLTRSFECGTLPLIVQGAIPPPAAGFHPISLNGWAHRPLLMVDPDLTARGTEMPRLWLTTTGCILKPVYQRISISGGKPPRLIRRGKDTLGAIYEDDDATYALLTGVLPSNLADSRIQQTASVFANIEDALRDAGMAFTNVVRTWLYLDRLLDWYDDFNKGRDAFFRSRHVYDHIVPASTGIGSSNFMGAAIVANAIAVKPKRPDSVKLAPLPSPLQCAAIDYGSSFSRAMEMTLSSYRTIFVSGTASIEPGGKTAFVNDIEKQINLTLDVVRAILNSRGMDWPDVSRSILYLKEESFFPVWQRIAAARGIENMPCVPAHADVCRDDLLVEIELDAVKAK